MDRKPLWWRLVGGLQWLLSPSPRWPVPCGCWSGRSIALGVARPSPTSTDGSTSAGCRFARSLLVGGVAAGMLLALLVKPTDRARRAARRGAPVRGCTAPVAEVAREQIVAPVRHVLHDYAEARQALAEAAAADR